MIDSINCKRTRLFVLSVLVLGIIVCFPNIGCCEALPSDSSMLPWWFWTMFLFGFTIILGIIAVIGGVGGGVLFVPIVYAVFPFHIDFVRGTGLLVALCGALSALPRLLKQGFAHIRLVLPLAVIGSAGSLLGAVIGLGLSETIIQLLLGITILGIVTVMLTMSKTDGSGSWKQDSTATRLGIFGTFYDASLNQMVEWSIHRYIIGMVFFFFIGIIAGMFGLGAGWANVPTLNLLLGAPLKVAVGSSSLILSINDTTAAWIYFHHGAILPLIAAPSVAGMMIGTWIGARLLGNLKTKWVRLVVLGILVLAGVKMLLSGLHLL